jgi:hypothetical protein
MARKKKIKGTKKGESLIAGPATVGKGIKGFEEQTAEQKKEAADIQREFEKSGKAEESKKKEKELTEKKIDTKKEEPIKKEKTTSKFRQAFEAGTQGVGFLEEQALSTQEIFTEKKERTQFGLRLGIGGAILGGEAVVGLGATIKGLFTVAGTVGGIDAIANWAAVDNFASSIPFQMNDILGGVNEGSISPNEANQLIQQAESQIEQAISFVNKSTRLNPFLWPGRQRFMAAVEKANEAIEVKKIRIENAISNRVGGGVQ